MVIMILETAPQSLRGELSRWLIEPHPGVFVGTLSAMVRDRMWQRCCAKCTGGGVVQIWSSNSEQGFQMRMFGQTQRELVDHDGLLLIRFPPRAAGGT